MIDELNKIGTSVTNSDAIGFVKEIETGIKGAVKMHLRLIMTAVVVATLLLLVFSKLLTRDTLDENFWVTFAVGLMLQILITVIWFPEGKTRGEENQGYKVVASKCAELVKELHADGDKLAMIDKFCEHCTEENRMAKIKRILSVGGIGYTDYQTRYLGKSNAEVRKDTRLSKKGKRAILKANNGVSVKPVNSASITALEAGRSVTYCVENYEKKKQNISLVSKMSVSVVTAIVMSMLIFGQADEITAGVFAKFAMWLATIGINIFTSLYSGYNIVADTRKSFYLRVTDFLHRFNAWDGGLKKSQ